MPPTPALPLERGRRLGLLLLLAAVAGGVLLALRHDPTPARPAPGAELLDEQVDLGAEPVVRRIRVAGPALVTVEAAGAPPGTVVTFGPEAPIETGGAPDAAAATTWAAGPSPRTLPAYGTGLYVLRLAAPAGAGATRVRLRVTRADGP